MAFFSPAVTAMLNALTFTTTSLHNAYPGSTGTNELSGGGYARQTPSFGSESGGVRTATSNTWSVGASSNVAWQGWWNGADFLCCAPNGGAPKEFVAVPSSDTIYCPSHGWSDTQTIVFWKGTVPGGLTEGTVYYVRDATSDTFKVAATAGGTAIDITSAGTSNCLVSNITVQNYASASSHTITSATIGLPL